MKIDIGSFVKVSGKMSDWYLNDLFGLVTELHDEKAIGATFEKDVATVHWFGADSSGAPHIRSHRLAILTVVTDETEDEL